MADTLSLSLKKAVEIASVALGEPPAIPPGCSGLIIGCCLTIFGYIEHQSHVVMTHRDFLNQIMRFLTAPRTAEQLRALRDTLEHQPCRCAHGPDILRTVHRSQHSQEPRLSYDNLLHMIDNLSSIIAGLLSFCKRRHKLHLLRNLSPRASRIWPVSPLDVLPGDPAASLNMLTKWTHLSTDQIADDVTCMYLFRSIIAVEKTYALVGLLKTSIPLEWLCRNMTAITTALEPGSRTDFSKSNELQRAEDAGSVLTLITEYMFDEELALFASNSALLSVQDILTTFLRCIQTADQSFLGRIQNPQITQLKTVSLSFVCRLLAQDRSFSPSHTSTPSLVHVELSRMVARDARPASKLYHLAFHQNHWTHRCYGPSCIATYSTPGVHAKLCGACLTAAYCSRECQKRAWAYPGAAHRDVCVIYERLRAAANMIGKDAEAELVNALEQWYPSGKLEEAYVNVQNLRKSQFERLSKLYHNVLCTALTVIVEQELENISIDNRNPWST
jgi:hypothetical protein